MKEEKWEGKEERTDECRRECGGKGKGVGSLGKEVKVRGKWEGSPSLERGKGG